MSDWVWPRSILFSPGHTPDRVKKAIVSSADVVCVDLEDGVAIEHKAIARRHMLELSQLAQINKKPLWVRINSTLAHAAKDIALLPRGVQHIVLPKTSGWSQVAMIGQALEDSTSHPSSCPKIIALIEDSNALHSLLFSANKKPEYLAAIALGSEDFSGDLGVKPNSKLLNLALYDCVKLARLLSLPVLGLPTSIAEFKKLDELEKAAEFARSLGVTGAFCIHPKQLDVINSGFSPSNDEVEWARGVCDVSVDVQVQGVAVHPLSGQMVDMPVVLQAREILKRYSQTTS